MDYKLINNQGDWSIQGIKRGSVYESRLISRLAAHIIHHSLPCNTPNYFVDSLLGNTFSYRILRYLKGINISGNFVLTFIFSD